MNPYTHSWGHNVASVALRRAKDLGNAWPLSSKKVIEIGARHQRSHVQSPMPFVDATVSASRQLRECSPCLRKDLLTYSEGISSLGKADKLIFKYTSSCGEIVSPCDHEKCYNKPIIVFEERILLHFHDQVAYWDGTAATKIFTHPINFSWLDWFAGLAEPHS